MVFVYGVPSNSKSGTVQTDSCNPGNDKRMETSSIQNGLLLIFNHDKFNVDDKGPRRGSERDVDLLTTSFRSIGYNVVKFINMTKNNILESLIANLKEEAYDCVTIAVMTYGELGYLYAYDTKYQEVEIMKCVHENTKPEIPKFIIFQASRTKTTLPAATYEVSLTNAVVAHSTKPGYNSYRSTDQGSYFIVALCHQLDTLGKYRADRSLESILECAKKNVLAECDKLNYTQEPQITYYGEKIKSITFKYQPKDSKAADSCQPNAK